MGRRVTITRNFAGALTDVLADADLLQSLASRRIVGFEDDLDPQAWLADVLARIADTPQSHLADLLPWSWQQNTLTKAA